jgi:hypothetical protein
MHQIRNLFLEGHKLAHPVAFVVVGQSVPAQCPLSDSFLAARLALLDASSVSPPAPDLDALLATRRDGC